VVEQDRPSHLRVLLTAAALHEHVLTPPAMAKQFKALLLSQSKKVWRGRLPEMVPLGAI